MKITTVLLVLCLSATPAAAREAKVTPLLTQDLTGQAGKEGTMILVEYEGPGETFSESPNDIHTVSRNASTTKPAKFVVFFVKQKGAPITVPVK